MGISDDGGQPAKTLGVPFLVDRFDGVLDRTNDLRRWFDRFSSSYILEKFVSLGDDLAYTHFRMDCYHVHVRPEE